MRTELKLMMLATTCLAFATTGCAVDAEVEGDEAAESAEGAESGLTRTGELRPAGDGEPNVVASVRTAADTQVRFVSGGDGELAVTMVRTTGRSDPQLESAMRTASDDPIALYEQLARRAAPATLKEAVELADTGRLRADASDDDGETPIAQTGAGAGFTIGAQTTASSGLCNIINSASSGSGKFIFCWPNQYSTPWVKKKVDHMACRFDVVSGPIRVRSRYKSGGSWKTHADFWLGSGQSLQVNGFYKHAKRWRECKTVDNPDKRRHHFRVVGHEQLNGFGYSPDPLVYFPNP
jgi:hypothetical protein